VPFPGVTHPRYLLKFLPPFLFPDLSASTYIWGETQSDFATGTFRRPGSRSDSANVHEGRLTFLGNRRPSATGDAGAEITTTNRTIVLIIPKNTMSSAISSESSESIESEPASAESTLTPHRLSLPASAPTASTPPPSVLEGAPGESAHCPDHPITDKFLTSKHHYTVTTTVEDAPLGLHNALDYSIAKHPKVMSTISNVLIIVGGIVLLPGVSTLASGTILAHPAVTVVGAIFVAFGKWLRSALNSAAAKGAAQARLPRGRGIIEDVNGHRRGRMERGRLLSVEFVV
jgi:hypothetical protein